MTTNWKAMNIRELIAHARNELDLGGELLTAARTREQVRAAMRHIAAANLLCMDCAVVAEYQIDRYPFAFELEARLARATKAEDAKALDRLATDAGIDVAAVARLKAACAEGNRRRQVDAGLPDPDAEDAAIIAREQDEAVRRTNAATIRAWSPPTC